MLDTMWRFFTLMFVIIAIIKLILLLYTNGLSKGLNEIKLRIAIDSIQCAVCCVIIILSIVMGLTTILIGLYGFCEILWILNVKTSVEMLEREKKKIYAIEKEKREVSNEGTRCDDKQVLKESNQNEEKDIFSLIDVNEE